MTQLTELTERVKVIEINNEEELESFIMRLRTLKEHNKIKYWRALVMGVFDLIIALSSEPGLCRNDRVHELFYKATKDIELDKNMFMTMKEKLERELKPDEFIIILTDRFLNMAMFYIKAQNNILTQITP